MKIICIGRNYTDHIEELQNEKPKDPVIFLKPFRKHFAKLSFDNSGMLNLYVVL